MICVRIDESLQHGQIFQQEKGWAEIKVSGTVTGIDGLTGAVCLAVYREKDGTMPILPVSADAAEDVWHATLRLPVGGLYTLRCEFRQPTDKDNGSNGDCRFHLGVGDIYVIAGQSNAAGFGRTPGMQASDERTHIFGLDRRWRRAIHPLSDGVGHACTPLGEWSQTGASPFVSFASILADALNYPIGLLQTAQGGMSICHWGEGALLYEKMVEVIRLAGGRVKGILWYQGCSDTDEDKDAAHYLSRFTDLVYRLRRDLNDPALPFLTVQINRFICPREDPRNRRWAVVKEAQRQAARQIEGVYVTASHDATINDFAHNSTPGQQLVGQRLAWLALDQLYGLPYLGMAPDITAISLHDRKVTLTFDHVYRGLIDCWLPPAECGFTFTDDVGPVAIERYDLGGRTLQVWLTRPVTGSLLCSFAASCRVQDALPFDRATGIPPLGFYRLPAKEEST